MKLSMNWIKQYVQLPEHLNIETIAGDLTLRTVEVEGYHNPAEDLEKVVLAVISEIQDHPQADLLKVVQCDVGEASPVTIVCGGINLYVGQQVALARPGSRVRWHGEGEPVEIKSTKLRGVRSEGMICTSAELMLEELFPEEDERVILDLKDFTGSPGDPLAKVLDLDDWIIDIDNKSLTNRPDLWCHYGIAREFSAIYDLDLKELELADLPAEQSGLEIEIENPEDCRRYAALVYDHVQMKPSPFWLQSMLWKVEQRPINLLVDITNYIMFATGQPTHGFDRDHVRNKIHIRRAREGEKLILLGGETLDLRPSDQVIANDRDPMALAGIKGGELDSILPDTNSIVLEVANFGPGIVRGTSQHFMLRTEASSRFEKHMDTQRVDLGLKLFITMMKNLMPQATLLHYRDLTLKTTEEKTVHLKRDFLDSRLGISLPAKEIKQLLKRLEFKVEEQGDDFLITAPSWRSTGDVSLADDILEEIARMKGYENFEFQAPRVQLEHFIVQPAFDLERGLREYLAFRCGLQEVFCYPWVSDETLEAAGLNEEDYVEIDHPPAPNRRRLRKSLIPNMLEAVSANLRYVNHFKIFELAQVFQPQVDKLMPRQPRMLCAAFVGRDALALFYEAKGMLEAMPRILQMGELSFEQKQQPSWADSKVWLNILRGSEKIGDLALVNRHTASHSGFRRAVAVIVEIELDKLNKFRTRENSYRKLPEFPLVEQDLSILLDDAIQWQDVERIVGPMVYRLRFIDDYRGPRTPEGKHSLSIRLWLEGKQATLSSEDIEKIMNRIKRRLNHELGGEIPEE